MVEPHKVVGNIEIAKGHKTSLAECSKHYGVDKQTKTLEWVVVDILFKRSDSVKKGATKRVADYDFRRRSDKDRKH